ncbi:MAG: enoyl-CoA hydratase/isomerase family protein [Chloroflexia bacterium]|nr:enoyl-CoA hydratase/isomerase family protein [Chloroflexia bacterium]
MSVDFSRDGQIGTVTLNQPERLNALDSAQLRLLLSVLSEVRGDDDVRCVIVTGAGERAFAAGANITEMVDFNQTDGLAFARLGHAATAALENLPQPVIAAMHGFALGGGCEIALACDIRLGSTALQIGQPEVSLGVPPGWGGTQRLPRLIGPGLAAELILTGRRVGADEALRIGLVNAIYEPERLLPEAHELAERIAANSPLANRAAKRAMSLAFSGEPGMGLAAEADLFAASFETVDQREGMSAFLEKRRPTFRPVGNGHAPIAGEG